MIAGCRKVRSTGDPGGGYLEVSTAEEPVEGPDWRESWERIVARADPLKSGGFQEARAETSVKIIQVSAEDDRRVRVDPSIGMFVEESRKLESAFGLGEAEVHVGDPHASLVHVALGVGGMRQDARQERTALFPPADGEVEVMDILDWKSTQDQVAIATDLEPMFMPEGMMPKPEL